MCWLAFVSSGDQLTDRCVGDFSFLITGLAELWYVVLSEFFRSKDLGCSRTVLLSQHQIGQIGMTSFPKNRCCLRLQKEQFCFSCYISIRFSEPVWSMFHMRGSPLSWKCMLCSGIHAERMLLLGTQCSSEALVCA